MDTPDLMAAIATRIAQVPGLAGASYPALNQVPESPWAFVIDGGVAGPSTVKHDMRGEEVLPIITIRLLVKSLKERPREAAVLDGLTTTVRDALNPLSYGGRVTAVLPDLPGKVDRLWTQVLITRGSTTEYAGEHCYAADLTIDPKFHRKPVPLEVTP